MAVLWSSDAYATGDFSLWTTVQEQAAADATVVTPPAEVGGGPQSRSLLGRYRIDSADSDPLGNAGAQRVEAYRSATDGIFAGHSCGGSDIWMAWESYFGNPSVVADTNAFRPTTGTEWNAFAQWHQPGGIAGTVPWIVQVDAKVAASSGWRWQAYTRGGNETTPTSIIKHDLGAFSYGWHEFRCYINWSTLAAQTSGRAKIWIDNVLVLDYTGRVGFWWSNGQPVCNYWKQGMYRSKSAVNCTVFSTGMRMGTTEADVIAGGDPDPPPPSGATLSANTRTRRFGKTTVGSGRNGFSADNKRGSKFVTGLGTNEEADVKDMHIYIEGMDGSASTQKVTLGIHDDGGTGGLPGTKFGESSVEITVAGNAAGAWVKVSPTTIRVTGSNAWLIATSGAPTNRLRYATDVVANALAFAADTYDISPPRLASPFGAASLTGLEMSIVADYDVVIGTLPPPGDSTAPALVDAATATHGGTVILGYDEPLNTSSIPAVGDYAVLIDGVARAVSSVTVSGAEVQLVLATPVSALNTITLSYTRVGGREIEDIAGNLAANLSGQVITNETSNEEPSSRLTTIARVTSIARVSNPSARMPGLGGGGV